MVETFIIIGILIACILGFAARKPDLLKVRRSIDIKAPPEKIFPLINDLRQWRDWSPFEKLDPAMMRRFSDPASGMGAIYAWAGNSRAGAGRMEITEAVPFSRIAMRLEFIRPFAARHTVVFSLVPSGDTTKVLWDMQGRSPFIGKLMQVFVNMDKMIGRDFEAGLTNMKTLAEK